MRQSPVFLWYALAFRRDGLVGGCGADAGSLALLVAFINFTHICATSSATPPHYPTPQPPFHINILLLFFTVSKFADDTPTFFSAGKAIARRSSSAARAMRSVAARIAPLDPQLTSSKREAAEQTV